MAEPEEGHRHHHNHNHHRSRQPEPGWRSKFALIEPSTIPYLLCVRICALTTVAIRILAYVFLRWIPSPWIPKTISTALAIFLPSFFALLLCKPRLASKSVVTSKISVPASEDHESGVSSTPASQNRTIEVTELVVTSPIKTSAWTTLALGKPSLARNTISTLLTLLINLGCFTATYDATYTLPHHHKAMELSFARTGWVSSNTARILVREPPNSALTQLNTVYVVSWREHSPKNDVFWNTMQVQGFSGDKDYTAHVVLEGLKPQTTYHYLTTGNHSGTFTTAPKSGARGKFTFLTSSCIKQRVPYNPFHHPLEIPGFKTLAGLLPALKAQFMLFLGDFIYIDVPMRPGLDIESYRTMYRQVYSEASGWPLVGKNLPWIHVLDDHEIANDWDQGDGGLYKAAIDPFRIYQHDINPPPVRSNATYYSFTWGSASFFMLDTRRYRSPNGIKDGPLKTMLGPMQLQDLLEWLQRNDKGIQWKFIVSSVPMTKNWQVNGEDTWKGFQWEREKILDAAWGVQSAGVVILSGDRHEFAATAFPPPPGSRHPVSSTIYEFSCSPLSQFYLPVRTYKQTDDHDVLIKYVPDGNSKFGAIEIDSTSSDQAVLKYTLFVDGEQAWTWVLTAPSARRI